MQSTDMPQAGRGLQDLQALRRRCSAAQASNVQDAICSDQDGAVDRVVVDDQDARAGHVDGRGRAAAGLPALRQRHGEPEGRALALLAVDADLAAHQLDQPRGDGEPEAGALVAAGRRGVDLAELLEDQRQACRRECRCRYRSPRCGASCRRPTGSPLDIDQHMAGIGELDRIADQIGDDLADAADIADIAVGQAGLRRERSVRGPFPWRASRPASRRPRSPRRA